MQVRRNPIAVELVSNWRGELIWRWTCDVHRCRGDHRTSRRADRHRRRMGLPPDLHPQQRAINAANRHHHQYHSDCPHREEAACRAPSKRS